MAYQRKAGNKITFWKVNHAPEDFSNSEWKILLEKKIIIVCGNGSHEEDMFFAIRRGDYFYLHHGNTEMIPDSGIKLIGRIIDDNPVPCPIKSKYFQRHYEMIFPTDGVPLNGKFSTNLTQKDYKPNSFSKLGSKTIYEIRQNQAENFVVPLKITVFYRTNF